MDDYVYFQYKAVNSKEFNRIPKKVWKNRNKYQYIKVSRHTEERYSPFFHVDKLRLGWRWGADVGGIIELFKEGRVRIVTPEEVVLMKLSGQWPNSDDVK